MYMEREIVLSSDAVKNHGSNKPGNFVIKFTKQIVLGNNDEYVIGLKVTRPSFFGGVPSYFEALWYPHRYFYRKSNT